MQERFYESGSCVQKNCAVLGVHPIFWVQLGSNLVQQRFQLCHFGRVMLPQQLRIVVDHLVRRMATPVSNDLTAHPGIHKMRNPPPSKRVHSSAWLGELQFLQDWIKLVLQNVRQPQWSAVLGLKKIARPPALEVFL